MLIFFSDGDLGGRCDGYANVKEALTKKLEETFGCTCVVIDQWCTGAVAIGEEALGEVKVLYPCGTGCSQKTCDSSNDIRKMLYEHAEQEGKKRDERLCNRNLVLKSLLTFLLGLFVAYFIKLL